MRKKCVRVVPVCKTPDNVWLWVKTNHPPPQKEAWHWSNQTIIIQKISVVSVKSGKKVIPRKVLLFCRKISTRMNRSIWILPGITGFSIQMVSVACLPHRGPLKNAQLIPLGRDKHNWNWLGHYKYSNKSPLPRQVPYSHPLVSSLLSYSSCKKRQRGRS